MKRSAPPTREWRLMLGVLFVLVISAANAHADIMIGAPTNHVNTLPGPLRFSTSLTPDPVVYVAAAVAGGLLATTFAADIGQFPGWTLAFGGALNGTLNITDYLAVVAGNRGGARMDATYVPAATDPAGVTFVNLFVSSNSGTHIDPFPNDDTEPLYYTAAERAMFGLRFLDNPSRPCPALCPGATTFDTYLATFNAATMRVTVYDGWEWGYRVVPGPPTAFLISLGAALLAWTLKKWNSRPQTWRR